MKNTTIQQISSMVKTIIPPIQEGNKSKNKEKEQKKYLKTQKKTRRKTNTEILWQVSFAAYLFTK